MQLSHIAYMRHYRNSIFFTKQTYGDKFTYAAHPYRIYLYKPGTTGLQIIFKNDPVRNMFPQGKFYRSNCICQVLSVPVYHRDVWALRSNMDCIDCNSLQIFNACGKVHCWLASSITFTIISGHFPNNICTADIPLRISGTHF